MFNSEINRPIVEIMTWYSNVLVFEENTKSHQHDTCVIITQSRSHVHNNEQNELQLHAFKIIGRNNDTNRYTSLPTFLYINVTLKAIKNPYIFTQKKPF